MCRQRSLQVSAFKGISWPGGGGSTKTGSSALVHVSPMPGDHALLVNFINVLHIRCTSARLGYRGDEWEHRDGRNVQGPWSTVEVGQQREQWG